MMRDEQEMLDLIIETAREDPRIRAVIMKGSRANPNAPRDCFQDFDIVYVVTDVAPFRNNLAWIERFGELMILQMPEEMLDPPPANDGVFVYLMQFADGNRIDLALFPADRAGELGDESLSVVLLDKDGIVPPLAEPDEGDYLPTPPDAKAYADCCNEFWWLAPYVAKGLWREEITYAKFMLDQLMRQQLMKMLTWQVGVATGFQKNPGKAGKYFRRYLEPPLWFLLQQSYADAGNDNNWQALFAMGTLFRTAALSVASHFGFDYPHGDDERVSAHLRHVHVLPGDAATMY